MARRVLEREQYQVIEAGSGAEAVKLLEAVALLLYGRVKKP